MTSRLRAAAVSVAALGLAAACGGGAPSTPAESAAPASAPAAHAGHEAAGHAGHHGGSPTEVELYAVQTGTLGVVVTDGEGRLLYGSTQDGTNPPVSHCGGACAQTWLPLVVPVGQEPQLLGVDPDQVGKLGRPDGSNQLTLGGWPLYVNKDDNGELKTPIPEGESGTWFAFTPQGQKVSV
jgi:predicted lipoprotein with Yx(FWY)xxD motif